MFQVTITTTTEYPDGRQSQLKKTHYQETSPSTDQLKLLRKFQIQEFKDLNYDNIPRVVKIEVDEVGQDGDEEESLVG